jgi:hypothetical protein
MGGLVCCGSSTERKERSSTLLDPKVIYHIKSSPGKHSGDADTIWELNDELLISSEKDFRFTKVGLINLFD